jgi:hypothetical protein
MLSGKKYLPENKNCERIGNAGGSSNEQTCSAFSERRLGRVRHRIWPDRRLHFDRYGCGRKELGDPLNTPLAGESAAQ